MNRFALAMILSVASAAHAELKSGTVAEVQIWTDGSLFVKLAGSNNETLCTHAVNAGYARVALSDSPAPEAESIRSIGSLLIAAKLAGKVVVLDVVGGSTGNSLPFCKLTKAVLQ